MEFFQNTEKTQILSGEKPLTLCFTSFIRENGRWLGTLVWMNSQIFEYKNFDFKFKSKIEVFIVDFQITVKSSFGPAVLLIF